MNKIIILLVFLSLISCKSLTTNKETYVYVAPDKLTSSPKNKCNCKEGEKGCISIVYKGKMIDTMNQECFQAMTDALEIQNKLSLAEMNKDGYSIKIELEHNPWEFIVGTKYKTHISTIWYDKNKKEIKKIIVKGTFEAQKEALPKWRIIYRNISEYGFPAALVCIFIMSFFI